MPTGDDAPSFLVVSSEKTPLENAVDQAMDAFVYAPIGLVLDGPALFPKLVQQGKNQVQVARMMGQMAVQMGQSKLTQKVEATEGPVRDVLAGLGVVKPAARPEPAAPESAEGTRSATTSDSTTESAAKKAPAKKSPAKKTGPKPTTKRAPKPVSAAATALGIPDYDSLSASQVVSRLRGLIPEELDAVQAYESANRARKTVLNKISQLQKD